MAPGTGTVAVELERADFQEYARVTGVRRLHSIRRQLIAIAIAIILGLLTTLAFMSIVAAAIVMAVAVVPAYRWIAPALTKRGDAFIARKAGVELPEFPIPQRVTLDEKAMQIAGRTGTVTRPWSAVRSIDVYDQLVSIRSAAPTIIPRRAFAGDREFQEFVALARELWSAGR